MSLLFVVVFACGSGSVETGTDADADTDTSSGSEVGTDTSTTTDTGSDTGSDSETGHETCSLDDEAGATCERGFCCYLDSRDAPICDLAGTAGQDEKCASQNDCGCALFCLESTTCAKWCGIGEQPDDGLCPVPGVCDVRIADDRDRTIGYVCRTPTPG